MAISLDTAEWVDRAEGDVRAIRKLDLSEDRLPERLKWLIPLIPPRR